MKKRTKEEVASDNEMGSKVCTWCGERKVFKEFSRNNALVDGRSHFCKECYSKSRSKTPRYRSFREPEDIQQDIILGSKVCNRCGRRRRFQHFPKAKKGADGHDGICYTCKPARDKKYQLATRYGLQEKEYLKMLEEQGFVCAICGNKEVNGLSLAVDHDHKTGAVRGLLCRSCNTGLGSLGDTTEAIEKVLAYLKKGCL